MRSQSMSGHFQGDNLGNPQAGAVGDAESRPVLQARRGFEKTNHLLLAQHDRRFARFVHDIDKTNEVGALDPHIEEESQRGDGGVDGHSADLLLGEMRLKKPDVLARRGEPFLVEAFCLNKKPPGLKSDLGGVVVKNFTGLVGHRWRANLIVAVAGTSFA